MSRYIDLDSLIESLGYNEIHQKAVEIASRPVHKAIRYSCEYCGCSVTSETPTNICPQCSAVMQLVG